MRIVKAEEIHLNQIMKHISECVINMKRRGLFQWDEKYPNTEIIKEDIKAGDGYIVTIDEGLAAYFCINEHQAEEYKILEWSIVAEKILVLHRLCVNPAHQNRGIGSFVMRYIEEQGLQNGYSSIRFDTYSVNNEANGLYKKFGYDMIGQVFFQDRELPFYCYEKGLA